MLLPARFQTSDDMPMSLGKAIAREIAPKFDLIEAFNKGDHFLPFSVRNGYKNPDGTRTAKPLPRTDFTRDAESLPAPPSTEPKGVRFRVGDRVRYLSHITCMAGVERVVSAVRENYQRGEETVTRIEFTCGPHSWDRADCLELIEPAPSPDAETVGDGWVTYKRGDEAPSDCLEFLIRWSDGEERRYKNEELSLNDDLRTWDGNVKSMVVAYKVIA